MLTHITQKDEKLSLRIKVEQTLTQLQISVNFDIVIKNKH